MFKRKKTDETQEKRTDKKDVITAITTSRSSRARARAYLNLGETHETPPRNESLKMTRSKSATHLYQASMPGQTTEQWGAQESSPPQSSSPQHLTRDTLENMFRFEFKPLAPDNSDSDSPGTPVKLKVRTQ